MAGFFTFLSSCKGQDKKREQLLAPEKFKVGQVWKYENRKNEDKLYFNNTKN
ncbi:hypothetical protein BH10BAC2_BH10BAC2_45470 [soil metagenome]